MSGKKMRIRFFKVTALLTAAVLAAGVFAGCGADKVGTSDKNGKTIVSVGNWPQNEGKQLDALNARKESFEAQNPDVTIEPDHWRSELKTFYAKAAGGQLPTVYDTYMTEIRQIIESGYSADLSEVLKKRGYENKFNPKLMEIITNSDGDIYAFPSTAYVLGMAYNTEMFEAAGLTEADGTPKQPKTWDDVVEFAKKIKEATGKPGFVFPTANNNGGWIFTCLAWSFGVDFMEKGDDGKWKATFNTPEAAEALQWIKDLKWKHDILPANTLIDNEEYLKLFATGNAGMFINAADISSKVVTYGMGPDDYGMFALPAGPKRHVTLLGGKAYSVSSVASEEQIDAAIRWIETDCNYKATDDFKMNQENAIKINADKNCLVGLKSLSIWNSDTESVKYLSELIDKNMNCNPNHVKLYNEFVENLPCEIQPEEPVCAQELYGILDGCIQEVLTNKNADCAQLLEKAASDFQANYLDNLDY